MDDFDRHIDDFPLATICLSLKAIALEPDLFNSTSEWGLLLNESDYRDLKASKTLQKIMCLLPDNELCSLLGIFLIVLSQKRLEVLSWDSFVLSKPIKRIDEPQTNVGTIKDELANDIVKIYNEACSMINDERFQNAYILFRQMSLYSYGQNGLGVCYANGFYVKKDMEKAAYWFQKAARQGLDVAQFNLANCYYQGTGVKKDRKLAFYWYERADRQGLLIAKEMFTLEGTGELMFKKIEDAMNVERWNRISSFFILTP